MTYLSDLTPRQRRDHERYLRQRESRLLKQRAYYQQNREDILLKKHARIERERMKLWYNGREQQPAPIDDTGGADARTNKAIPA